MFQSAEITLKYSTLFNLSLKHNYYTQPLSKDFSFIPTLHTNALLQKMNGVVRQTPATIRLLYDEDRMEGLAKFIELNEKVKFSFWVLCDNLYFSNYTEINHLKRGGGFYFKNHNNNNLLHVTDFVETSDYYEIAPSAFFYPTTKDTKIGILNAEEKLIIEEEASINKFQVDLRNQAEGLYHLQEDGIIKETFLYYTSLPSKRPIGLVDLWLDDDWKKNLLSNFNEGQPADSKEFEIQFANRKTYWRYFVILRYQKNGEDSTFSITSENEQIIFEQHENFMMPNSEKALVFCSTSPIPLTEAPKLGLKLQRERTNKGIKVLMHQIPAPSVQSIKPDSKNDDAKIYSDVIIYV